MVKEADYTDNAAGRDSIVMRDVNNEGELSFFQRKINDSELTERKNQ